MGFKSKLFTYFFSLVIFLALIFMLLIYFDLYSKLPSGFYIVFIISFFTILIFSIYKFETAILIFLFFIPLFGFLGPLFQTQDAYIILVMCTSLIIGYLIRCIKNGNQILNFDERFYIPIIIILIILTISFILVIWRIYLYDFKMYGLLKQYINNDIYKSGTDYFKTIKSTSIIYSIFFTGFLFQIIMAETSFSKNFINKVFYILFFSFFIVFIVGIYQRFFNHNFGVVSNWNYENMFQINSTFRLANALGQYLIFIVPLFIGFSGYFFKISKIKFILCLLSIMQALILLYYNGNRTGILGIAFVIIFYIIFFIWILLTKMMLKKIKKINIRNIISMLIILIIFIGLFSFVFIYFKNLGDNENRSIMIDRLKYNFDLVTNLNKSNYNKIINAISSGRDKLWLLAVSMFKDYPITGVGIGQYEHMLLEYNMKIFGKFVMRDAFALNYYLHILAELGIFYLLAILWFLIEVIVVFTKKIKRIGNKYKFLYSGIFLALISSLIAFNFNAGTAFIETQYMFSFTIGLLINKSIFTSNENNQ